MDKYLGLEFDRFGFSIDSAYVYVSLSWGAIITAAVILIAYKIYKKRNERV